MWEAMHATLDFDMNGPIWINNVAEVVLINDFFTFFSWVNKLHETKIGRLHTKILASHLGSL
jgi:hypothetical protein